MASVTFERAIEVFVRGFCFTRSITCPYLPELVDGVWVMRDHPDKKRYRRVEEFVGHGVTAPQWAQIAINHAHGPFRICAMLRPEESDCDLRREFRELRFRLMATEEFFAHGLASIPPAECGFTVSRVESVNDAAALAKATRRRQILDEHLNSVNPPMRQYVVKDGDKLIGWAASIVVGDACWCSNVFVQPEYRRQGIARAMLSRLLADDKESDAVANVLLASHAGSKLYPTAGYESIGRLLMFTPPKQL